MIYLCLEYVSGPEKGRFEYQWCLLLVPLVFNDQAAIFGAVPDLEAQRCQHGLNGYMDVLHVLPYLMKVPGNSGGV